MCGERLIRWRIVGDIGLGKGVKVLREKGEGFGLGGFLLRHGCNLMILRKNLAANNELSRGAWRDPNYYCS